MSQKLEKLQSLLKLVDESISRADFEQAFSTLINFVKQIQLKNKETMDSMETKFGGFFEELSHFTHDDLEETKHKVLAYCEAEMQKMMDKVNQLQDGAPGKDGQDADEEVIAIQAAQIAEEALTKKLPTLEQLELRIPELGKPIRDSLELLPEGEKLKIEAIEDLRKELDELKKLVGSRTMIGGGGAVGLQNAFQIYDLSDSLDGVTKTFSVPAMNIKTITLSSNPFNTRKTFDWTYDASTSQVTFTSNIDASTSLAALQTVLIYYS